MNYCEKCKALSEGNYCSVCGTKNLREAKNDDYCFVTEVKAMFGEMFEDVLKQEEIPCVSLPCGNGVRTLFGLKLENYRLYVPFEFLDKSLEILEDFTKESRQDCATELKSNLDKLNANPRTEKKMKKSLKLNNEDNLFDYCKERILQTKDIVDGGQISGCFQGGHYLFVYTDREVITINSQTNEILAAKLTNKSGQ